MVACALFAGVVLAPVAAFAEASTPSTSFDTRFAAIEAPPQADDATPKRPSDPHKNIESSAKDDAPALRGLDARARYRALIEKAVTGTGLAPEIAEAVMGVESGYNPGAIGGVGEIGLMQILPSTARMLGFNGSLADLAGPETNIRYGTMYLAQAWRLAGGDLCTAVMKYRAGHGETRFSYLSVNYCLAVRSKLVARGFQVTGNVPVATFGQPGGGGGSSCGRRCRGLGGSQIGRVDLAALNTRLSAIVVQVRGGR
ncbi:lytic transglycosylase domain-containing protein [Bradyrhizobium prioriisuperbiae]|uniref:lytic transglycosylase domain-containing protein n=1 Tax=Bradyrhizobium prioriisuperbiae TaxID=2854389 RepID=UPI0038992015